MFFAVVGLLKLSPVSVAGQAQTATQDAGAAPAAGPAPDTPWGEPDLQGIWTDEYRTPLERPARYANRAVFTNEERAARRTERDVRGAYNAVFESIRQTGQRTSLIVDPPDGRIPPFTPEAQRRSDAQREYRLAVCPISAGTGASSSRRAPSRLSTTWAKGKDGSAPFR